MFLPTWHRNIILTIWFHFVKQLVDNLGPSAENLSLHWLLLSTFYDSLDADIDFYTNSEIK